MFSAHGKLNCYSSCGMWTDETDQHSGVRRCLAVGGLRNGEGARGAPANFKIQLPIFCLFGLENVLCCALRTLAKLIDGITQWISQSYCIVDSHTRLSHCESLTLHSYCLPWSWGEESVYTLLCQNIIYPSTMFFSPQTHSLPFQNVLYSSSEMNVLFTLRQP